MPSTVELSGCLRFIVDFSAFTTWFALEALLVRPVLVTMEMPFVGFNTLSLGQQHGTGASPQRIGTMQQQQQMHSNMQRQADSNKAPSFPEEIKRLAKEYHDEGRNAAQT